jgi:hypothetical protein
MSRYWLEKHRTPPCKGSCLEEPNVLLPHVYRKDQCSTAKAKITSSSGPGRCLSSSQEHLNLFAGASHAMHSCQRPPGPVQLIPSRSSGSAPQSFPFLTYSSTSDQPTIYNLRSDQVRDDDDDDDHRSPTARAEHLPPLAFRGPESEISFIPGTLTNRYRTSLSRAKKAGRTIESYIRVDGER